MTNGHQTHEKMFHVTNYWGSQLSKPEWNTTLLPLQWSYTKMMTYYLPLLRQGIIKKLKQTKIASVGEDVEKWEHICSVGENVKMAQLLWKIAW
jgi:hypothetical protein